METVHTRHARIAKNGILPVTTPVNVILISSPKSNGQKKQEGKKGRRFFSMLQRKQIDNHDDWINARKTQGIGASSAAAIVGLSPFQSSTDLWRELTGQAEPKDLSDSEVVKRGHELEPILRNMFEVLHPEYRLEYHEFDLLYRTYRPWAFCTLDGELTEIETGRRGLIEIKTASLSNKAAWAKWDGRIPDNYLVQCLWQLECSGFEFAILYGALFSLNGSITIREYLIEKKEYEQDIEWLMGEAEKFWQHVQDRTLPPVKITL